MDEVDRRWLDNFLRINRLNGGKRMSPITSQSPRKGPQRLGRILEADALAIRITNRRARAGLKPTGFTR